MGKKPKSKYIGSCGIYVIVDRNDGYKLLLCHRRSKQLSESGRISTPGGIVERSSCALVGDCSDDKLDFNAGARSTALKELLEEAGVLLGTAEAAVGYLPVGADAYWGAEWHRNFFITLDDFPAVHGPEPSSRHEVMRGGMEGVGTDAGDGHHAWVDIRALLARPDLMKACRKPLEHFLEHLHATPATPLDRTVQAPRAQANFKADSIGFGLDTVQSTPFGTTNMQMQMQQYMQMQQQWWNPVASKGICWQQAAPEKGLAGAAWTAEPAAKRPKWAMASESWAMPSVSASSSLPTRQLQEWAPARVLPLSHLPLPRIAIFDLDETCWRDGIDRKPFKGPPFVWSSEHSTLQDCAGNVVKFYPELRSVFMSLHRSGVQLAIASHNTKPAWCNEVLDKVIIDEDAGLTWGELVPESFRIINCNSTYYPLKDRHVKELCELASCELKDAIFFDDGRKICSSVNGLGCIAVRCEKGLTVQTLLEALKRFKAQSTW